MQQLQKVSNTKLEMSTDRVANVFPGARRWFIRVLQKGNLRTSHDRLHEGVDGGGVLAVGSKVLNGSKCLMRLQLEHAFMGIEAAAHEIPEAFWWTECRIPRQMTHSCAEVQQKCCLFDVINVVHNYFQQAEEIRCSVSPRSNRTAFRRFCLISIQALEETT